MKTPSIPLVFIAGTNPGAGTTTVTAVLATLAASTLQSHVLDFSDCSDLRTVLRLDTPTPHPGYHDVEGATDDGQTQRPSAAADAVGQIPHRTAICFTTASSLSWRLRRQLERMAAVRVLVMEPSGRGVRATVSWLTRTLQIPTLVVINALPSGTQGWNGRQAIESLKQAWPHPETLATIRRSVAIHQTPSEGRSPAELIQGHPMMDDYLLIGDHIMTTVLTQAPRDCGALP